MKKTINESDFVRAFDEYNRADNFSIEGRKALFDYIEGYEDGSEQEQELDVIALCCEFTEYESVCEAAEQYFTYESKPEGTLDENEKLATAFLEDNTSLILVGTTGRVIIGNF